MSISQDQTYMQRALALAEQGAGWTAPNPMVGAVIVKDDRVIGEGFHRRWGAPHAEVEALTACSASPEGATMYVTLEPCSHYGKTPPCTEAILAARLSRVVVAMQDPNPLVAGRGIDRLRAQGVDVAVGLLETEARKQNCAFIKQITIGQPWVTIKAAVTADGKIATRSGSSQWITCAESRRYVHQLRSRYAAILTGIGTVLADNPMLNCRLSESIDEPHQPVRLVVDSSARLPLNSTLATTARQYPTLLFHTPKAPFEALAALQNVGIETVECPGLNGSVDLNYLMQTVAERGINSVLVEAGGSLNGGLMEQGLIDELLLFVAPKLVGGASAPTFLGGTGIEKMGNANLLTLQRVFQIGSDVLLNYYIDRPLMPHDYQLMTNDRKICLPELSKR